MKGFRSLMKNTMRNVLFIVIVVITRIRAIDTLLILKEEIIKKYYTYKVVNQVESMEEKPNIRGPTRLNKRTRLGKNTQFNGLMIWGEGTVKIGDNFRSGPGCHIRTITHNYHGNALPYDDTWSTEEVIIGDNVWIGQNVKILPGVEIGEGAIIQIDSVVINDVPECAIVGGHPAEVFGYRDRDHYERLKSEGKFS